MAGETIKSEAICLSVNPWSRTSHIVTWLTPSGRLTTVARGAERPKSHLLGQYDLNYTCEIVYYARARGDVHALRECCPLNRRDPLRTDFRALALAGYFRYLAGEFAPDGPDAAPWFELLSAELDRLAAFPGAPVSVRLAALVRTEMRSLSLLGLAPDLERDADTVLLRGERRIPVSREVADYLRDPRENAENITTPLDAVRVIGVFYHFHLGSPAEIRRAALELICK